MLLFNFNSQPLKLPFINCKRNTYGVSIKDIPLNISAMLIFKNTILQAAEIETDRKHNEQYKLNCSSPCRNQITNLITCCLASDSTYWHWICMQSAESVNTTIIRIWPHVISCANTDSYKQHQNVCPKIVSSICNALQHKCADRF